MGRAAGQKGRKPRSIGFSGRYSLIPDGSPDYTERMRAWFPILTVCLCLPVFGCADVPEPAQGAEEVSPFPALPPALVAVAEVEEHVIAGHVRLVGTASPWRRSTVASEVAGIVAEILVEEGEEVAEGRVLANLRRDILERLREKQEADLEANRAAYKLMVSRRIRNLALLEEKVISLQQFDDSVLVEEQALHRVAGDEAELLRLRSLIKKTTIRAPFSGIVIRKETEVGEWVPQGGVIVEMVDPGRMEVRIDLPERYVSRLDPEGIRIHCDAAPGLDLEAELRSIAPVGDVDTRTFPLRLEIPNPGGVIRGGMLCRATLPLKQSRLALFVPKDAVVDDGSERVVFTIEEGVARRRPVRRGEAMGNRIEVEGDLSAGQMVVIRGNEGLQDGQRIHFSVEFGRDEADSAPGGES